MKVRQFSKFQLKIQIYNLQFIIEKQSDKIISDCFLFVLNFNFQQLSAMR